MRDFTTDDYDQARHDIVFDQTTVPTGFPNVDTEQLSPFQFGIGDMWRGWRVHGYIALETFYIVWLDTDHLLYGRTNRS